MAVAQTTRYTGRTAWARNLAAPVRDFLSTETGGAIALLAAAKEKHIGAVGLLASPGLSGRDTVLEQQQRALARLPASDGDKQAKVALQAKVIDAVISGSGWEALPAAMRTSADTPLFKSWLLFDPAAILPKIHRPLLILQGALDTEMPVAHADRLEELARRRSTSAAGDTRKVILPGINHLLAAARTGEVEEYASLQSKDVSSEVTAAIAGWLRDVWTMRK